MVKKMAKFYMAENTWTAKAVVISSLFRVPNGSAWDMKRQRDFGSSTDLGSNSGIFLVFLSYFKV